ncbi:PREDICTED: telomere repeat-binding factor 1-like [Camelina sativa]|uniref:MYB transcription factor n=1 Tax=Camelina sativa TaxID=90675 RepID=A0ABM0VVW4_CAMSA|nr:PREDICTED: telomere repeat-binding factor 1-like [Camelina sativa]XP_010461844.1 PREDICTED: telomere repeat-binding factor 1-like [Camelina sativa]XP_010461845.1 PREDICTED: telomere repeat-binding factor 1-like [Camelina sativa]
MGAPKQKWTQEEESALKSGVIKHGPGKWRTILKDPEFSGVLYLRSNVDLKDKWRNMSVMANGWGSREKSRLAVKRTLSLPRQEENSLALTPSLQSDEEMVDAKHYSTTGSSALQVQVSSTPAPRRPNVRLDSLIMEAIATMKEPGGCNKTTIGAYIEDQYHAPPDFKRLLSTKLKYLTACGKLVKVKRRYRIPNSTPLSSHKKKGPGMFTGRQRTSSLHSPKTDRDETTFQTRSQVDAELARMKSMNVHEAAAVAAQAVAEAEAAMAEAEEAAKEAEVAEAEAEAAQAFAEEASKTLKGRNNCKVMIRA